MMKRAAASLIALGAATVGGVDASVLNEKPVQAEYQLSERVVVEQKGNVVEATLPWKDQPGLKVKYDMGKPTASEKRKDKRKREVITEQVEYGGGGFKMDVLLHSKPDSNTFCYQIEGWEDYDFFYQPALTAEETAEGAKRPEEIVGSYAVYHKTLKNHKAGETNYETGKVAHIPYPYIWSVNATSTTKHRAEAFDITDGNMCVTVAQSDLDTMEYPVRVDPTFGYTSVGGSEWAISDYNDADYVFGNVVTSSESGTLDSMSAYIKDSSISTNAKFALYEEDSEGANSHGRIFYGEYGDLTASYAWVTKTAGSESISATDYIVAAQIQTNSTGYGYAKYDSSGIYGLFNPTSFADPLNTPVGAYGVVWSIYATYTASGGGSSPAPAQDVIFFE